MLAPRIDLALKRDLAPWLSPIANCREKFSRGVSIGLPQIQKHRLARRNEMKTLWVRHFAIGVAVIFAPREKRAVRFQKFNRARQNQPLVGLLILKGFEKDGSDSYTDGTIYDPTNGKTYDC